MTTPADPDEEVVFVSARSSPPFKLKGNTGLFSKRSWEEMMAGGLPTQPAIPHPYRMFIFHLNVLLDGRDSLCSAMISAYLQANLDPPAPEDILSAVASTPSMREILTKLSPGMPKETIAIISEYYAREWHTSATHDLKVYDYVQPFIETGRKKYGIAMVLMVDDMTRKQDLINRFDLGDLFDIFIDQHHTYVQGPEGPEQVPPPGHGGAHMVLAYERFRQIHQARYQHHEFDRHEEDGQLYYLDQLLVITSSVYGLHQAYHAGTPMCWVRKSNNDVAEFAIDHIVGGLDELGQQLYVVEAELYSEEKRQEDGNGPIDKVQEEGDEEEEGSDIEFLALY
ncbi:hypothetical protein QBC35DRAFT_531935 [Podospora australis]|uniref:Uncharacterized protein n=1 Tax=Podospora australis TaxID=1536484 RepID=A0AAN7AJQ2_9PEZI|nr:hypothetical protein QBC35DRAFT_531935 [Podospora australis]